jgi:hypothetical protein
MIRDNNASFAVDLAYDGTSSVVDTGITNPGKGEGLTIWVQGTGLTASSAVVLLDGTTSSPSTTRATYIVAAAALNAGLFEFKIPSNTQRYLKLSLTGATTGGTWNAGVSLAGNQTSA